MRGYTFYVHPVVDMAMSLGSVNSLKGAMRWMGFRMIHNPPSQAAMRWRCGVRNQGRKRIASNDSQGLHPMTTHGDWLTVKRKYRKPVLPKKNPAMIGANQFTALSGSNNFVGNPVPNNGKLTSNTRKGVFIGGAQ